jgi:hypothetical protein
VAKYETAARQLRKKPLIVKDGGEQHTITYATFVGSTRDALLLPDGYTKVVELIDGVYNLVSSSPPASRRAAARRSVLSNTSRGVRSGIAGGVTGRAATYHNGVEAYLAVACTDGLHPADASRWRSLVIASDQRAPYFGRSWAWSTSPCARATWTVRDEDAYRGPFTRRTSAPVLIVGNYYDPATNYDEAVSTAKLLPNSRLLSSDSWGHVAYGTSGCATGAIDAYLLRGALPRVGTVCVGDIQPFAVETTARAARSTARRTMAPHTKEKLAELGRPTRGAPKKLPPIATSIAGVPAL